jgi:uncharacterized coiled-coil DUF342 family protein
MIDEMKRDIERLKSEVADLRGTDRRIAMTLLRLEEKVDGIVERMATKADLNVINARLDGFSADIQAARRDRALYSEGFMAHQRKLEEHEARILRVETRKSS